MHVVIYYSNRNARHASLAVFAGVTLTTQIRSNYTDLGH